MHDALDFVFVDTTACTLDAWHCACRATVEDGDVGSAVLMVLSIRSELSAGTISASDSTEEHQQLFAYAHIMLK